MNPGGRRAGEQRTRGFAVVLMVALLAAIVLLLVALAALTRGELRATAQQDATARARANALVGLRVALGRLQAAAGPDACNTAQARQSGSVRNPFWTAVWRDSGAPLWLVSGDPVDADREVEVGGVGATGTWLVANHTTDSEGGVAAPWEEITTKSWPGQIGEAAVGRYAFWIGDEGVKGHVAIVDRVAEVPVPAWPAEADPVRDFAARDRLRQLVAHRSGSDALNDGDPPTSGFLLHGEADTESTARWEALNSVLTFEQLRFVAPETSVSQFRAFLHGRYHDLTVNSLGLLVDASRGGLRHNYSDLAASGVPAAVKDLERFRPVGGRLPLRAGTAAFGEATAQCKPIVTEWALDFVPYRENGGDRVLVGCRLRLELWNPLALPLAHTPVGEADYEVRVAGLPAVRVAGPAGLAGEWMLGGALGANNSISVDVPGDIGAGQVVVVEPVVATGWPSGLVLADPTPENSGDEILRIESIDDESRRLRLELWQVDGSSGNALTVLDGFPSGEFARSCAPGGWSVAGNRPFAGDEPMRRLGVGYHGRLDPSRSRWGDWVDAPAPIEPAPDPKAARCVYDRSFWETVGGDPAECARSANALFVAGELFSAGRGGVAYDFTVQRNLSIAALGQISEEGRRPFAVGSPWGGMRNDVFDAAFFNPVPANWHEGDPLPNVRHRVLPSTDGPRPDAAVLAGWDAARVLGVAGMFNVNSVSADAWTVVLGRAVPGWTDATGQSEDLENPFFILGQSASFMTGGIRGRRTFSDQAIQELATALVARIRGRSRPFRSLAEFVNSGVLAAAIADAGLNTREDRWADLGAAPERCSPDWLTQAAVLNTLAPLLAVRSDTFTIRVAAEALNPALPAHDPERVSARAWCEAVVQRFPEFVAPSEAAEMWPPTDSVNATLGRRFRIVAFRWLGPDDL